jgi:hypothetical protein
MQWLCWHMTAPAPSSTSKRAKSQGAGLRNAKCSLPVCNRISLNAPGEALRNCLTICGVSNGEAPGESNPANEYSLSAAQDASPG